jgi:hypothetical protein
MKNTLTHFLSAFVTIVLDWLWLTFELLATLFEVGLVFTSVALGLLCSIIVMLIQRFSASDDWGAATAKGLVMGMVAGVPYPVIGTVVGALLASWSGIRALEDIKGIPNKSG